MINRKRSEKIVNILDDGKKMKTSSLHITSNYVGIHSIIIELIAYNCVQYCTIITYNNCI